MKPFSKIGNIDIPAVIAQAVENNEDRLIVEQTSFDAVNGYAQGIGTKVKIQRFFQECSICGYHSLRNPNQKKMEGETMHRLLSGYETIFYWDDYGPHHSLEDDFRNKSKELYGLEA